MPDIRDLRLILVFYRDINVNIIWKYVYNYEAFLGTKVFKYCQPLKTSKQYENNNIRQAFF